MAEAEPYFLPLKEENGFLPDLGAIPEEIAKRAVIMFLNFPGNPVPAMATESFYREVVEFAKRYNVLVVSDFAYGELYYDGNKPVSFLSVPGAKDVGVEINSLSKSYHMAGCRVGYVCGNAEVIRAFAEFKSNLDYGIFGRFKRRLPKRFVTALLFAPKLAPSTKRAATPSFPGWPKSVGTWTVHKPACSCGQKFRTGLHRCRLRTN